MAEQRGILSKGAGGPFDGAQDRPFDGAQDRPFDRTQDRQGGPSTGLRTGGGAEEPGTYVLVLYLDSPARVVVGALGSFELDRGYYLYVGSALNGLAGRLRRHCRTDGKRLYWHIDYLRAQAALVEIWWTVSAERLECDWAAAVRRLPGVSEPVAGFGASDCHCSSHLFHTAEKPSLDDFAAHAS